MDRASLRCGEVRIQDRVDASPDDPGFDQATAVDSNDGAAVDHGIEVVSLAIAINGISSPSGPHYDVRGSGTLQPLPRLPILRVGANQYAGAS